VDDRRQHEGHGRFLEEAPTVPSLARADSAARRLGHKSGGGRRGSPVQLAPPLPQELFDEEPLLRPAPTGFAGPSSLSLEEDALMASLARLDDRLRPREEEPIRTPSNHRAAPKKPQESGLGKACHSLTPIACFDTSNLFHCPFRSAAAPVSYGETSRLGSGRAQPTTVSRGRCLFCPGELFLNANSQHRTQILETREALSYARPTHISFLGVDSYASA